MWMIRIGSLYKCPGDDQLVLTLNLEEDALGAATKKAADRLSHEVKVKGFRPGKVPLKMIESVVGAESAEGYPISPRSAKRARRTPRLVASPAAQLLRGPVFGAWR